MSTDFKNKFSRRAALKSPGTVGGCAVAGASAEALAAQPVRVDRCWSRILNPVAAKDHLRKHLVTAPANKVLSFGGDCIPVERVLGHALIARRGIAQALGELVEPLLHGNARRIFRLEAKAAALRTADWVK